MALGRRQVAVVARSSSEEVEGAGRVATVANLAEAGKRAAPVLERLGVALQRGFGGGEIADRDRFPSLVAGPLIERDCLLEAGSRALCVSEVEVCPTEVIHRQRLGTLVADVTPQRQRQLEERERLAVLPQPGFGEPHRAEGVGFPRLVLRGTPALDCEGEVIQSALHIAGVGQRDPDVVQRGPFTPHVLDLLPDGQRHPVVIEGLLPVGQVGMDLPDVVERVCLAVAVAETPKTRQRLAVLRHRRSEIPENVLGTAERVGHTGHERIIQRAGMRQGGCERDGRAPGVAAGQL